VLILAGVSQAALGYYQFALSTGPQAFIEHRLFLRAFGSFDQPNPFAGYLNMVLPIAAALAIFTRGTTRVLYALAALFLVGAMLASQSRGALLAGTGALAVVCVVALPRSHPLLWLAVLAGAIGAWLAAFGMVPTGAFERVLSAVGLGGVSFDNVTTANFSAVERAAHWLAGVRMFAAHPLLGVGIGNYAAAYPAYHPRGWYASLQHAHNYYINIAAESGIVGLAAYLLVIGTALWYSCAAVRWVPDGLRRAAALGVLGVLVATSLHNLFDVLYVHGMVALLGLLMAIVSTSFDDRSVDAPEPTTAGG
jgi:O-antigen ligase